VQFTDSEIDSIFSIPPESDAIRILRRRLAQKFLSLAVEPAGDTHPVLQDELGLDAMGQVSRADQ